jgi:hypothetical protein
MAEICGFPCNIQRKKMREERLANSIETSAYIDITWIIGALGLGLLDDRKAGQLFAQNPVSTGGLKKEIILRNVKEIFVAKNKKEHVCSLREAEPLFFLFLGIFTVK